MKMHKQNQKQIDGKGLGLATSQAKLGRIRGDRRSLKHQHLP